MSWGPRHEIFYIHRPRIEFVGQHREPAGRLVHFVISVFHVISVISQPKQVLTPTGLSDG